MSTPAGWHPSEGRLRYWDGAQWTNHFAPIRPNYAPYGTARLDRASDSVIRASGNPSRPGLATWFGWGGLVLVALLGAASSGVSGFFILTGLYVLVVAVITLIRGHVDWALMRGRGAGAVALGSAIVLFVVGGATADPTESEPVSTPTASATAPSPTETAATPSPSATPSPTPTPSPTKTAVTPETAAEATALAAVADLTVKGRAPKTGYDRNQFGQAWYDSDRNGCDTRNDILRRDLRDFTLKAGTNGCLVLGGTLTDPYTAEMITFVRGSGTSSAVQIDHVVALSDAWQKGAQQLSRSTRTAFANDPLNLLAVDGPTNTAKGDGDAATWLPPTKTYRCSYLARQVAVKVKYDLWVTAAERDALVRILQTCPTQKLPTSKAIPLGGGTVKTVTPTTKAPSPTPTKTSSSPDPRFDTCKAAKAAGYGPYHSAQDPEYDWYSETDSDGIVCE